jgi:hypothetical protein
MLVQKACPNCHGDLEVERNSLGEVARCASCGYLGSPDAVRRLLTLQALDSSRQREAKEH